MGSRKWNAKPYPVVHPRRGQKYRVAQLCATWHTTGKPSIELLADIFGISPGLIYQAMAAARPHGRANGHVRPAKVGPQRPIVRSTVTEPELPLPVLPPTRAPRINDAWEIAEELVHVHGADRVFDRVIAPAIS
jgi:hypothetical protein